jgi:Tol biopolymer transport system component
VVRRLLVLGVLLVFAVPASATTSRILAPMDWWPVWSPTAKQIAFTRVYPNRQELWVLSGGRGVHIGTSASQLRPSWSSDGKRLAYSSGGVVYTVNPSGSNKVRYAPHGFAPAWRPKSSDIAYLNGMNLFVAGKLWATNVIGAPAWSPDGSRLAFQRDDGLYIANGSKLVTVANPGAPAWSHDGKRIAYTANGRLYTVTVAERTVKNIAAASRTAATPSWSHDDAKISTTGAYSPKSSTFVAPGPKAGCPGHTVLKSGVRALTGSCLVVGTAKADVIEGTPLWGDIINAGARNDRVHANDRHTDRVNCGPGRDTVWADRTDRLTGCEIIHR